MRIAVSILLFLCACWPAAAQMYVEYEDSVRRNYIHAATDRGFFLDEEGELYMEYYIAVNEQSMTFKPAGEDVFASSVQADFSMKDLGSGKAVFNKSFEIKSVLGDTSMQSRMYMFEQLRVPAAYDSVEITLKLSDNHVENSSETMIRQVALPPASPENMRFSSLRFFNKIYNAGPDEERARSGFVIPPVINDNYFESADTIRFYLELYNLKELTEEPYFIAMYLTEANQDATDETAKKKKIIRPAMPEDYRFITGNFSVSDLPSQTYALHVALKTNSGKELARKTSRIFIHNPSVVNRIDATEHYYDQVYGFPEEKLDEYLEAMKYLSSDEEQLFIQSLETFEDKKKYFYAYWRDKETDRGDPMKQWRSYRNRIEYARQNFKTTYQPGWNTARGRVLLTYGEPQDIQRFPIEHDKYPYEVWTYNHLEGQGGVIFVFYDRDLVTNTYPLLHSTLTGEVYNANWREMIMKSRRPNYNMDPSRNYDNFKETTMPTIGSPR